MCTIEGNTDIYSGHGHYPAYDHFKLLLACATRSNRLYSGQSALLNRSHSRPLRGCTLNDGDRAATVLCRFLHRLLTFSPVCEHKWLERNRGIVQFNMVRAGREWHLLALLVPRISLRMASPSSRRCWLLVPARYSSPSICLGWTPQALGQRASVGPSACRGKVYYSCLILHPVVMHNQEPVPSSERRGGWLHTPGVAAGADFHRGTPKIWERWPNVSLSIPASPTDTCYAKKMVHHI